jgi:hypothetical protein
MLEAQPQPPLPCVNCVSSGICRPDESYYNHGVRNIIVLAAQARRFFASK